MSPTSVTVSKSTRTSYGSILLTSISLTCGVRSGLSVPLRGEAGVFGRVPSRLLLREGVGGNIGAGLLVRRVRDSVERGALYFLDEERREGVEGVVERGRRESPRLGSSGARESLRLGVKGTGRAGLLAEGVDIDIVLGPLAGGLGDVLYCESECLR